MFTTPFTRSCSYWLTFASCTAYPSIDFTLVVNPASGPGPTKCPDANYLTAIAQLNQYANVRMLGYVASTAGDRPASAYQADIDTYSGWSTSTCAKNIAIDGIFVDEVNGTDTMSNYNYYRDFYNYVQYKMPAGKSFVTLNPGVPMSLQFYNISDSIITFEGYHSGMKDEGTILNSGNTYKDTPRQKQAIVIHDYTGNSTQQQQMSDLMGQTEAMGWLYITNALQAKNPYGVFPSLWKAFVAAVNSTNKWMASNPSAYP